MGSSHDSKAVNARILCVDDDSHTIEWMRLALNGSGAKVDIESVDSGRDAFVKLTNETFDLCILDYALPDMTGVQLCSLMRHMGCDIPIVFFTAMNRDVDRQKATEAGANGYLIKPDDLDIFTDSVTHHLRGRRRGALHRLTQPQQHMAIAA